MTEHTTTPQYIDPATLMQIRSLELRAKAVMEGLWTGLNRSPWHGFSVEFTEYRQYAIGDDPRFLDWKLYARSDRHYIKKFEDETNLRCQLVVDFSRSMSYGSESYTKSDYARTFAATLAYFLAQQRDAVGLVTFDETIEEFIPPRFRTGHLRRLMLALDRATDGNSTNLNLPLQQVAERLSRRGMLIFFSDLLAPLDELERNLGYLCARGHDVIVFQLLDRAEVEFDFDHPALFHDLESGQEIYVNPGSARTRYQQRLADHLAEVQRISDKLGLTYKLVRTDEPLEHALSEFLRGRMQQKQVTRRAA